MYFLPYLSASTLTVLKNIYMFLIVIIMKVRKKYLRRRYARATEPVHNFLTKLFHSLAICSILYIGRRIFYIHACHVKKFLKKFFSRSRDKEKFVSCVCFIRTRKKGGGQLWQRRKPKRKVERRRRDSHLSKQKKNPPHLIKITEDFFILQHIAAYYFFIPSPYKKFHSPPLKYH